MGVDASVHCNCVKARPHPFPELRKENQTMPKFDITKLNVAVDKLLDTTTNPRHRFMLQAYSRHRYLEVAGRYEEIFAPDMMNMHPRYVFKRAGNDAALTGQDSVKALYRFWAETNQSIIYVEDEEVAVSDHCVYSIGIMYQQVSGKSLKVRKLMAHLPNAVSGKILSKFLGAKDHKADNSDMYLYRNKVEMVWPYDDRCRLLGEDVYEPDPEKAELFKLDRADVLTTEESGKLLAPLIKPLPSFDEVVLGNKSAVGA